MQIPRLYNVYKAQGLLSSFAELLANVFAPLFEVTLDPGSHPQVRAVAVVCWGLGGILFFFEYLLLCM